MGRKFSADLPEAEIYVSFDCCALFLPEFDLENVILIPQREMWWCLCS